MSEKMKAQAREILDQYLESNLHRKTPERYAILDAVFSMRGHFTLEELGAALERKNFRVSRATLYNTIHLFLELRLVVRHSLVDGPSTRPVPATRTTCIRYAPYAEELPRCRHPW